MIGVKLPSNASKARSGTRADFERQAGKLEATAAQRTDQTLITADAGYYSDANLKALAEQEIPALIADNGMRKRDERFKDQGKYKALPDPLYDKAHPSEERCQALPPEGL